MNSENWSSFAGWLAKMWALPVTRRVLPVWPPRHVRRAAAEISLPAASGW